MAISLLDAVIVQSGFSLGTGCPLRFIPLCSLFAMLVKLVPAGVGLPKRGLARIKESPRDQGGTRPTPRPSQLLKGAPSYDSNRDTARNTPAGYKRAHTKSR